MATVVAASTILPLASPPEQQLPMRSEDIVAAAGAAAGAALGALGAGAAEIPGASVQPVVEVPRHSLARRGAEG